MNRLKLWWQQFCLIRDKLLMEEIHEWPCPTCGGRFGDLTRDRVGYMKGGGFQGVCKKCSDLVVATKGRCFPDKIWMGSGFKHYCKNGVAMHERDACIETLGYYYLDDEIRALGGVPEEQCLPEGSMP